MTTATSAADVITEYYARLDGDAPGDPIDLLAAEFRFAMDLIGEEVPGGHMHTEGSREQMRGYVENRPPGRRHHLVIVSSDGPIAVLFGRVSEQGADFATFLAAVRVHEGKVTKYLVSRSSALNLDDSTNP